MEATEPLLSKTQEHLSQIYLLLSNNNSEVINITLMLMHLHFKINLLSIIEIPLSRDGNTYSRERMQFPRKLIFFFGTSEPLIQ